MLVLLGVSTRRCLSPTLLGNTPASTVAPPPLRSGLISGYPPICSLAVAALKQRLLPADTVATTAIQYYDALLNIWQYPQSAFSVRAAELLVGASSFELLDLEIEHLVFSYLNAINYSSHSACSHIAGLIVGFQKLIEQDISQLQQFSQSDLDKLAQLRVLEVTNSCVQWGFRRKDEHSLSVDETRKCMKMVMGFIKEKKFYFPSKGVSSFNSQLNDFIDSGRELYQNAFKNNVPGAKRQYYALSTAQFIVYGRPRLEAAIALVKQD